MAQLETTFAETFTSTSSTSGQENTIVTTDPGFGLQIGWVGVFIASGAGTDVSVSVFDGENRIAPQDEPISIPGEFVKLPTEKHIGPDSDVVARHSNSSTTDRAVSVVLAGTENP